MQSELAMMVSGYVLGRIAFLAVFAYLVYRVLRPRPQRARVRSQGRSARERLDVNRSRR